MKIGVTGIHGLIGWHLRAFLYRARATEVKGADRETFTNRAALASFAGKIDALVHLAGMNRGDETELETVNARLTKQLVSACEDASSRPHMIFASSIHVEGNTAYGRSKRDCAATLKAWAENNGAIFTNLILPHVFGEFGRPFYNSVVSTFCYQFANGESPTIVADGQLELVHAQEVAKTIERVIQNAEGGEVRVRGAQLSVREMCDRLQELADLYTRQVVPDLRDPLNLSLFNTYRSYLFPKRFPVTLPLRVDNRGELFESVKSLNAGQVFFSRTKAGVTRGNHYHTRKIERFLVTSGEAVIRLRKLFTKQIDEFRVSGKRPQYIDMPTFYTHDITNVGEIDLDTLFWANEIFDPSDSDTYPEAVAIP